ncbi:hypothetical protein NQ318_003980 [Aromia moschata]|uniref:Uncharacterized protein n=1 Tax=Aromia moschata TaxID=1265417 RepID=A0AAV8Z9M4_9CUCU|nr:hypothetical protein NQ318_003980 [Aromia moschata]
MINPQVAEQFLLQHPPVAQQRDGLRLAEFPVEHVLLGAVELDGGNVAVAVVEFLAVVLVVRVVVLPADAGDALVPRAAGSTSALGLLLARERLLVEALVVRAVPQRQPVPGDVISIRSSTKILKTESDSERRLFIHGGNFVKLACLWITEVIHVLVQCAQLKELLLLPKVCVKIQDPQLVTEHNNLMVQELLKRKTPSFGHGRPKGHTDCVAVVQGSVISVSEDAVVNSSAGVGFVGGMVDFDNPLGGAVGLGSVTSISGCVVEFSVGTVVSDDGIVNS